MRWGCMTVLSLAIVGLAVLLLGCGSPVRITAPAPLLPMSDFEPEGEAPSFDKLHERYFQPHWL